MNTKQQTKPRTQNLTTQKKRPSQQINDIVRRMVRSHFETEDVIDRVVWFKSPNGTEEIHLLEVNREAIPSGAVMTFYVGKSKKFPLPTLLADVTPAEWKKIRAGKIPLPEGWSLNNVVEFAREEILTQREQ